jgi:hypothetical protein
LLVFAGLAYFGVSAQKLREDPRESDYGALLEGFLGRDADL